MAKRELNADRRATEREQTDVTVGGGTFHPKRMTNKVVQNVQAIGRKVDAKVKELGAESEEAQKVAFGGIIDQLALLLVADDGQPPAVKHLADHLDQRDATWLLQGLLEDEDGGNSSPPETAGTAATTSG